MLWITRDSRLGSTQSSAADPSHSDRRGRSAKALLGIVFILATLLPSGRAQGSPLASGKKVRISVLSLFHPQEVVVSATGGHALVLQAAGESFLAQQNSAEQSATIRLSDHGLTLTAGGTSVRATAVFVGGRASEPGDFVLAIPGKISRQYRGELEVRAAGSSMLAILTLDLESAVASVVAAESLSDTPLEALKAQAIAARSYFVAGRGRHQQFDFCDTTHCQFFRNLPAASSTVAQAVSATRDLVLVFNSHPFAAMYTRSCSGRTRTPAELRMNSSTYPYFSVECKYCRAHPSRWSTRMPSVEIATLHSLDESSRIKTVRRVGWDAVPSNDFAIRKEGESAFLHGIGQGHGIGLCQSGSAALARDGANYREILSHYYPNTEISAIPN